MGDVAAVGALAGAHVALRRTERGDAAALQHIVAAPELEPWRRTADLGPGWPTSDPTTQTRYTILVGLRIAGLTWYSENEDPRDHHARLGLVLAPDLQGRGLGRDTFRTLARHLFNDRGHHRLVVCPASTNEVAIRCCTAVGFRPVGTMNDQLIMDLLHSELR